MYVKLGSLENTDGLADFVRYTLENAATIAGEAQFVPLNQQQVDAELQKLDAASA